MWKKLAYTNGAHNIVRMLVTKSSTTIGSVTAISEVGRLCESNNPTIERNSAVRDIACGYENGVICPHHTQCHCCHCESELPFIRLRTEHKAERGANVPGCNTARDAQCGSWLNVGGPYQQFNRVQGSKMSQMHAVARCEMGMPSRFEQRGE